MKKQVICVRKDLKLRKGKMIAQGCHASLMSYLVACNGKENYLATFDWLTNHGQTKICVGLESEEELLEIYQKAKDANLPCALVIDSAKTELDQPTRTACAIGPASAEEIDKITGNLKLL